MNQNLQIFLSHKADIKHHLQPLQEQLSHYEIDAFLAHEDIEPTQAWQSEIEKYLDSMDVLLAFITDGYDKSSWTNQEVGYALGREIPVISLKFGENIPQGFINKQQALRCSWENSFLYMDILELLLKSNIFPEDSIFYKKYLAYQYFFSENKGQTYRYQKLERQSYYNIKTDHPNFQLNKWSFVYTNLNDYGYYTICYLFKGSDKIANIRLAHEKILSTNYQLIDYLPIDQDQRFFILDNRFFSRISFEDDSISNEEKQYIRIFFNDIETHPEIAKKYHKYDITKKSLFRGRKKELNQLRKKFGLQN